MLQSAIRHATSVHVVADDVVLMISAHLWPHSDIGGIDLRETDEYAQQYFDGQRRSNEEFWDRFGKRPTFAGMRVLEVGCGHGAMAIELAREGASVLAVDLDEDRIDFAHRNLGDRFSELADRVTFAAIDVDALPDNQSFDIIVSKDTLEHVEDVTSLLRRLGQLLKSDGVAYVGFSPLYYSPYGDHGRSGLRVPWAHAVIPQRLVRAVAARHNRCSVRSLLDIGLNGYTPRQFRQAFADSGVAVLEVQYNRGDKTMFTTMSRMRDRFPSLEPLFTVNIYAKFGHIMSREI